MQVYKDILAVRLEDGRTICVSAPGGTAFERDMVRTTTGLIGQVIAKEADYDGSIKKLLTEFVTVRKADRIWAVAWEAAEVKTDA